MLIFLRKLVNLWYNIYIRKLHSMTRKQNFTPFLNLLNLSLFPEGNEWKYFFELLKQSRIKFY